MTIEIGFTDNECNTQYAPLAAVLAHYQAYHILKPLAEVAIPMKIRCFSPADKLSQVLVSMLAGCETLSEVNCRLKPEVGLAGIMGWSHFADQSSLSRMLDALTLKQIEQIHQVTTAIRQAYGQVVHHDWRRYLWLDFDVSGLPCSLRAEQSQKGYFSQKKHQWTPVSPRQRHSVP